MALNTDKNGFIIIEVLISIFIIFLVIVTIVATLKQKNIMDVKINDYNNLYVSVKSMVNYLDKADINTSSRVFKLISEKKINGFNVKIYAKLLESKKNYVVGGPDEGPGGNIGNWLYKLYKIKLLFNSGSLTKTFTYDLLKVEKLQ